ncbi:CHAD domain-containing protein [Actinomarinicola tropica]|uniref:CHAD domain-containing protein n=1 Tax=Actinomarinicola tropica TaxID=2789776 RepID=A0A5Q2RIN0_9ACTN|nr:CHAD domain-containing protein [Actinomarinicola tropica]QGG94431.1 CHAD domain-containing protein [Actinomarinicola tropica]
MATYELDPTRPLDEALRRVALGCLDEAIDRLDGLGPTPEPEDVATAVHEVRKRGKELRGLARLARPALGDTYAPVNADARDAGRQLSDIRDAQVLLSTLDDLVDAASGKAARRLTVVRDRQAAIAAAASASLHADDPRIADARERIVRARALVEAWPLPADPAPLRDGLERTYRDGRTAWRRLEKKDGSDRRSHEWRKAVKRLWYQARLLAPADPDTAAPLVAQLDELSDLLGDDHDLAVLVESLDEAAGEVDDDARDAARRAARRRQRELRTAAIALGREVYGGSASSFVARLADPWDRAVAEQRAAAAPHASVERERTFLVRELPDLPDDGTAIRQGYLALDGDVAVRVRETSDGARTLTIKGGSGRVRTELEWKIGRDRFEAAWPHTAGRRIEKTRYRIPIEVGVAELDVFAGDLQGLVLVEVEADSDEALAALEPPAWFGDEVTDDERYANASLAVHGRPG